MEPTFLIYLPQLVHLKHTGAPSGLSDLLVLLSSGLLVPMALQAHLSMSKGCISCRCMQCWTMNPFNDIKEHNHWFELSTVMKSQCL